MILVVKGGKIPSHPLLTTQRPKGHCACGTVTFYIKDAPTVSQKELRIKYISTSILFVSSLAEDDVKILTF